MPGVNQRPSGPFLKPEVEMASIADTTAADRRARWSDRRAHLRTEGVGNVPPRLLRNPKPNIFGQCGIYVLMYNRLPGRTYLSGVLRSTGSPALRVSGFFYGQAAGRVNYLP